MLFALMCRNRALIRQIFRKTRAVLSIFSIGPRVQLTVSKRVRAFFAVTGRTGPLISVPRGNKLRKVPRIFAQEVPQTGAETTIVPVLIIPVAVVPTVVSLNWVRSKLLVGKLCMSKTLRLVFREDKTPRVLLNIVQE